MSIDIPGLLILIRSDLNNKYDSQFQKKLGYKTVYISGSVGKITTYPMEPSGERDVCISVSQSANPTPMMPVDRKTVLDYSTKQ